MNLKICWMYHDLMDLYGDKGNIQVLKIRAQKRNIECIVDTCSLKEEKDLSAYDLLFIGGGADKEQSLLVEDLLSRKENIRKAMDEESFILLICGGYQLFGQYYLDGDGNKIEGLGFFDYYTESASRDVRCIGNIAIEVDVEGEKFKAVGFENHGGQTKNVSTPFGRVLSGQGNSFSCGFEGFYNGSVLGTYMHGPLLPKNPQIADLILRKALKKRYGDVELEQLDDTLENKARDVMLTRILKD